MLLPGQIVKVIDFSLHTLTYLLKILEVALQFAFSLQLMHIQMGFFVCFLTQMKLLGECSGSIDSVKRLGYKLKEEEEKLSGLINLNSTETQTAGK